MDKEQKRLMDSGQRGIILMLWVPIIVSRFIKVFAGAIPWIKILTLCLYF